MQDVVATARREKAEGRGVRSVLWVRLAEGATALGVPERSRSSAL